MSYLVFIFILALIACCSSVKNENKQKIGEVKKTESNNLDANSFISKRFDIYEYKQKADSLIGEILGENIQTKMTLDSLKKGEVIFAELKTTLLSDLVNENKTIKCTFSLIGKHSRLKHHLIQLHCVDETRADSVFSVFEKTALENSGVPGLTYTSDYLVKIYNEIYWLNSNCSYSYYNHLKFVEIFKRMKQLPEKKAIECECGKVRCVIFEKKELDKYHPSNKTKRHQ